MCREFDYLSENLGVLDTDANKNTSTHTHKHEYACECVCVCVSAHAEQTALVVFTKAKTTAPRRIALYHPLGVTAIQTSLRLGHVTLVLGESTSTLVR